MSLYDFADIVDWQGAAYDTTGDWVLGSAVPATGLHGPGVAYNDLEAADLAKEICARLTLAPQAGVLSLYPDSSFSYVPAGDGALIFQYQLYVNRIAIGAPQTVALNSGSGSGVAVGATLTGVGAIIGGGAAGTASGVAAGCTLFGAGGIAAGAANSPASATASGATIAGGSEIIAGMAVQIEYARAPEGAGYAPERGAGNGRVPAAGSSRPAALQRNER